MPTDIPATPDPHTSRATALFAPDAPSDPGALTLATFVTTDGTAVTLLQQPDGGLVFQPRGQRAPLAFDKFQVIAMRAVFGSAA